MSERSIKTRSRVSHSSRLSNRSQVSDAALFRAEAAAALAQLTFTGKETELKLEKTRLEASIEILNLHKTVAIANAKADALDAALDTTEQASQKFTMQPDVKPETAMQRTKEYVLEHSQEYSPSMPSLEKLSEYRDSDVIPLLEQNHSIPLQNIPLQCDYISPPDGALLQEQKDFKQLYPVNVKTPAARDYNDIQWTLPVTNKYSYPPVTRPRVPDRDSHSPEGSYQHTPDVKPALPIKPDSNQLTGDQQMSDLVRFMARREMITSGLVQFDEKPENYRAWKASFKNAIEDLHLSYKEETDLLVKWLGPESSRQVKGIRAVYVNDSCKGLQMSWQRLNEDYGAPEKIEKSLWDRIDNFGNIFERDCSKKLREFSDLVIELLAAKNEGCFLGLGNLDSARGIEDLVKKLPDSLKRKWASHGTKYKEIHNVLFPPFSYFVQCISQQAKMYNDPGFAQTFQTFGDNKPEKYRYKNTPQRSSIRVHKTEVSQATGNSSAFTDAKTMDLTKGCPIHHKPHPLYKCRGFRSKSLDERKTFLKQNNICYRCYASNAHLAKDCDKPVSCTECNSDRHVSALHPGPAPWSVRPPEGSDHGGEGKDNGAEATVTTTCTEVCGGDLRDRSCSKICLVSVYPTGQKNRAIKLYAILDDQSNRSLVRSEFFEIFGSKGQQFPYSLRTCAGVINTSGRRAQGFELQSLDGKTTISLPTLIECNEIPNDRTEIPTPEVALHHNHLKSLASEIPKLDPSASILMLLGRDIIRVHKVRQQINGPHNAPYAHRLDTGWVIVGNVCLKGVHRPDLVHCLYTRTSEESCRSLFPPCPYFYNVRENYDMNVCVTMQSSVSTYKSSCKEFEDHVSHSIFQRTTEDETVAPSLEDLAFMKTMNEGFYRAEDSSWVAPLPFKPQRKQLPNNKEQVLQRFRSLQSSFKVKPEMRQHFFAFMGKVIQNGHAEIAPPLNPREECWYLPLFGVYHPKKPQQIRVVFDSSAQCCGVSLNDILLKGPDLNNNLLGVLLRFRKDTIAFMADIQQMFHCFLVRPEDRNYLRFFWHKDNDPAQDIIEWRMKVHIFGNRPSPAVAIYGLRQAACQEEKEFGTDAKRFVKRDFYVDDGLKSVPTAAEAIDLLNRTRKMLACSNLRLHKIASNSSDVMAAFSSEDHATDLKDLNFNDDDLPMQRSLGICWDLKSDSLTFQVSSEKRPFTRRGVLSTINSLYDPLGIAAPVTIQGKALLRDLTSETQDWDAPLPEGKRLSWEDWKESLHQLKHIQVTRPYVSVSCSNAKYKELCVFSDASMQAIAAVAYLKVIDSESQVHIGFVLGKAKLAPCPELTVPRLELCAAVLAVDIAEFITKEIDTNIDSVSYFTDSRIVLGYICNEKRRFYVFVSNRVQRIRRSSLPEQWHYVSTESNPADLATRSVPAAHLKDTMWFTGPPFLSHSHHLKLETETFTLVDPAQDTEIRPQVTTLSTTSKGKELGSERFCRFSSWSTLTRALARLIHVAHLFKQKRDSQLDHCKGWHLCRELNLVHDFKKARSVIIQNVQKETFAKEIQSIVEKEGMPNDSPLRALDPFIDENRLLRVGGRLRNADLGPEERNPIIVPGHHYIATLIARHYHIQSQHQGRHITEGAIRSAGYWITGGKRRVSSLIFKCVMCKKLRNTCETQKMADLPPDRLRTDPPFTHIGLDVFGPWTVCSRRTRGGSADSKRWAVLFTCLNIRAIHIEVIESMDTSSFINSFRRFFAIRGQVKTIRSDRGTNFVGACRELGISSNLNYEEVESFLSKQEVCWIFNPPHASYMGGVWERMIGVARRILDSMLLQLPSKLSHEVLITLMAEVTAIVNSRPLTPVSTDPEDPQILTPATLLTQKFASYPVLSGNFDGKDLYKRQWRQVQSLAKVFWDRWRKQYLSTLQVRRKWQSDRPNINTGDLVLLKDQQTKRNEWPMGRVTKTFPDKDGKVRKVEIKIARDGSSTLFFRPVTELILLLQSEDPTP
ncbi:uncharacterized protein LOC116409808 [Xenopus tropicalis]|uniref:Uncharacterized protein LOC116409808 n=1 Tax=Xenopus tropicalis TaxID=8364 RepID=A0A8J1JBG8_XENTR|nr:uncharacterized protein LOC116409808 [Xenopus tropicalis]